MPASPQNIRVWVSAIKTLMGRRNLVRKHNQDFFCPHTKLLVITLINVYHTLITSWAWFAGAEVLANSPTSKGAKLPCMACKDQSCEDVHRRRTRTCAHAQERTLMQQVPQTKFLKRALQTFLILAFHFCIFGVLHAWCSCLVANRLLPWPSTVAIPWYISCICLCDHFKYFKYFDFILSVDWILLNCCAQFLIYPVVTKPEWLHCQMVNQINR